MNSDIWISHLFFSTGVSIQTQLHPSGIGNRAYLEKQILKIFKNKKASARIKFLMKQFWRLNFLGYGDKRWDTKKPNWYVHVFLGMVVYSHFNNSIELRVYQISELINDLKWSIIWTTYLSFHIIVFNSKLVIRNVPF